MKHWFKSKSSKNESTPCSLLCQQARGSSTAYPTSLSLVRHSAGSCIKAAGPWRCSQCPWSRFSPDHTQPLPLKINRKGVHPVHALGLGVSGLHSLTGASWGSLQCLWFLPTYYWWSRGSHRVWTYLRLLSAFFLTLHSVTDALALQISVTSWHEEVGISNDPAVGNRLETNKINK